MTDYNRLKSLLSDFGLYYREEQVTGFDSDGIELETGRIVLPLEEEVEFWFNVDGSFNFVTTAV